MPQRVPVTVDYPGAAENAAAWGSLQAIGKALPNVV